MSFQSFGEVLARRAQDHAERGFTYLIDGEQQEVSASYSELDRQARSIAKVLHDRGLAEQRVILLFPPGIEFIAALFGCFYSGAVAVPLAPPNPKRMQDELRRMAVLTRDSGARCVLTTQLFHSIFQSLPDADPAFTSLEFLVIEEILAQSAQPWHPPLVTRGRLAFLQYTSGSTGTPKGVMVTHANLLENAALLMRACEHDADSTFVSWLPMFHDFGLIGGVLQPIFIGASCTLLSPLSFLQRPVRWLRAITRYRARTTGAPNFAFELCVRKIADKECEALDLSSWRIASCAAEPIRKSTLERFTERFARYGFRGTTFWPCYGLAESTLLTTGGPAGRGMITYDFSGSALEQGHARPAQPGDADRRTFVALGNTHQGGTAVIVSVATQTRVPDGEVGEIWLFGPSIAAGYFGKPEQTAHTFRATLSDEPGKHFLRTGDLGFLHDGELFVTGRLKDLLIIRGRNHYPQDIELTVDSVSDSIRAGCTAAFSIEVGEEEAPVVVAELTAGTGSEAAAAIGAAIRQAVSERHGLWLHALCLVPPGSVPKTSSGKLQRGRCRADFLSGRLQPLWQGSAPAQPAPAEVRPEPLVHAPPVPPTAPESAAESAHGGARVEAALAWLRARLGELAQAAGAPLDPESPLTAYGLDSLKLVGLSGELAEQLGQPLPPTFCFDHPTVAAIAGALRGASTSRTPAPALPAPGEPIAIIGMACRWPGGVTSPEAYWQLLAQGQDAIEPFPAGRWNVEALYDPDPGAAGKTYCKHGGFLHGLDRFDAPFFAIAAREAAAMEPQQRLVLETAWEAVESAQIPPSRLAQSRTGVYLGSLGSDYRSLAADEATLRTLDGYAGTGQASSVLSGRVAYALDLQGPALTVDTACSSSLVALHLACEGLRRGDCDLAVAGGVQVMNTPAAFVEFSRLRGLAPDGRCKSFGAEADGTGWSEGCGVLLLKRLADAERDGDAIRALIRGTAINQDGRSQGLTAPNGPAQERVIRAALSRSGLQPADLDAVEAHGTGTRLGDPIEAGALSRVFAADRERDRPLYLGSSKSNLGHTQAAAGVAGVMKVVLSLLHEQLPKTLHAQVPSPHIEWATSGLSLLQEARAWPRGGRVRRAGVSSFGISGTNAHVVLEEAPPREPTPPAPVRSAELLIFAGRSAESLEAQAARLHEHLQTHREPLLGDVAYSLATTRSAMPHRLALVASSRAGLLEQLASVAKGASAHTVLRGRAAPGAAPKVVFVFPGQGSQWLGMGRTLLSEEPVFRETLVACDRAILSEAGFSVLAELTAEDAGSRLHRIDVVQPVLLAMSVSLSALWRSWGVAPDAVVGHSMGEIAAAHVAGALTLADAAAIVCRRSRLLQRISGQGEMALVELPAAQAERAIAAHQDRVSVAVSNSPRSTVIAGEPAALTAVLAQLESRGVFCRRVNVDVASHSPQVEPLREELLVALRGLAPRPVSVPMRSTVSGELLRGPELLSDYWAQNLRQPVRFADAVQALVDSGHGLFVEMSPHPILVPAVEEIRQAAKQAGIAVGSLRRGQPERAELLAALGALWVNGHPVLWEALFPAGGRRVELPTYPWQRQRYWLEAAAERGTGQAARADAAHPLLGEALTLSTQTSTRLWQTTLELKRLPWLRDHRVQGAVVFPAAGYVEMALSAGADRFGAVPFVIHELSLLEALVLAEEGGMAVQVVTTEEQPGSVRLQVASRPAQAESAPFRVNVRAVLRRAEPDEPRPRSDLAALRARMPGTESSAGFYAALSEVGLEYGPAFQGLRALWLSEGEALGHLQLPRPAGGSAAYRFHPALLDACLQVSAGCFGEDRDSDPWVPVKLERLRLLQRPAGELYCHVQAAREESAAGRRARACVTDAEGAVVAELEGLVVQRLTRSAQRSQGPSYVGIEWEVAHAPAARLTAGRWLLLGEGQGLGDSLRAALASAGHAVVHVIGLPAYKEKQAVRALLASSFGGLPPTGVVHLGGLDGGAQAGDEDPARAWLDGCVSVLSTVQALVEMGYRDAPRLWLLTRGAQAVTEGEVAVMQAPLLGLGRTIALEQGELRCARLDLDPARPAGEEQAIRVELVADDREEEIALRAGERRVARLISRSPRIGLREKPEPARDRPFRLAIDQPGVLDRLVLRATQRQPPGSGEVEIAVEAAGLNFLDVLLAMGALPKDPPLLLGGECAGRIVAVGEGVRGLAVGDSVMALAAGSLASHVTTQAALVLPRPAHLSAHEAAALPIACLTAYYALAKVGRLERGERVLIHSATGGVGLAALQWARHVGAEVYATAGTAEKRAYLGSLGVRYVSDSRSDRFVSDVLEWTGGEGVDVVLNSLSGELIQKGFNLLRDHGRFIELGKRDYYANQQLGTQPFLRNLSFSLVDLQAMLLKQPARVRSLLEEVSGLIASGPFTPPPIDAFLISRAGEAFRKMARGQHLGKVVLALADPAVRIQVETGSRAEIRSDGSYLITGGLGGLGLSAARWLAEQGAGQLVLLGRTAATSAEQRAAIGALGAQSTRVMVRQADVSQREQVAAALREIDATGLPLRGVLHAAGVLDDAMLQQQSAERLERVMRPKAQGAWNLHELTRQMPLDFFVMYASAAGLLGSPGQGNYAAASAYLDALAHHRRAQGLPALSIDWGPFSEVGLAAAQDNRGARLSARGMRSLTIGEGLEALGMLLSGSETQVAVAHLSLRQWAAFHQVAAASPRLSRLRREFAAAAGSAGDRELLARLASVQPAARPAVLAEVLRGQVAQVLRIPEGQVALDAPLTGLGMDSLMGLELRNRIEALLGVNVAATLLWTYPTLTALSGQLAGSIAGREGAVAERGAEPADPAAAAALAVTDDLSKEEDLFAALDESLARRGNKVPR